MIMRGDGACGREAMGVPGLTVEAEGGAGVVEVTGEEGALAVAIGGRGGT